MTLATRTTVTGLVMCILLSAALGLWIEQRFNSSMAKVARNTALFLGQQVEALLHDAVIDSLKSSAARKELIESLSVAADRSIALIAIDVVDADGKVIASDSKDQLGESRTSASEQFSQVRTAMVQPTDEDFSRHRRSRLLVPLNRNGELSGYLSLLLRHDQIEQLYSTFYISLTTAGICALVAVLVLGALLHLQTRRIGDRLSKAIESMLGDEDDPEPIVVDQEFQGVHQAAQRVGAELRAARGEVRTARNELNMLANATRVGVLMLDSDGDIVHVTDPAKELIAPDDPDSLRETMEELRPVIDGARKHLNETPSVPATADITLTSGRGNTLHLEFYALGDDDIRGCLVLVKDRGMMEALETDLRAATHLRGLNTLYLGATHDIRSPLNAINMNMELLRQGLAANDSPDAANLARYTNVIQQELDRLHRRLEALIRQAAPIEDEREDCDLVEILSGLIELLEPQARAQRVQLAAQLPDAPLTVTAPATQLRQAIMNLLVNALEAMPNGGTLSIDVGVQDDSVQLCVTDSGPGIPVQLQRQIFDMHFTTKGTGTGIGLYVVREIVQRNGGSVEVSSELGDGTRAIVTMPRQCKPSAHLGRD